MAIPLKPYQDQLPAGADIDYKVVSGEDTTFWYESTYTSPDMVKRFDGKIVPKLTVGCINRDPQVATDTILKTVTLNP